MFGLLKCFFSVLFSLFFVEPGLSWFFGEIPKPVPERTKVATFVRFTPLVALSRCKLAKFVGISGKLKWSKKKSVLWNHCL